ncbi:valacyclovir hydrolase [Tetranychus urticae]|nr:valacyclovir hydrolase [Tetranychus urticae]
MPENIYRNTNCQNIDNDVVTGYFEQDGYKIHYEKVGHGDCVVFMAPGGCGNARADLGPIFDGFDRNKFTLVGWDSPGFGLSRPFRDYKRHEENFYQYDAETAVNLMQYLGYDSFSMMGWSEGSRTALMAAILFPAKIDKVVVWASLAMMTEKFKDSWLRLINTSAWSEKRMKKYLKLYGNRETIDKVWYRQTETFITKSNLTSDRLNQIQCPVFVLNGSKDVMVPVEFFNQLVANIPDVESHLFPDGGHDIHFTHSEKFNGKVQRFLLN